MSHVLCVSAGYFLFLQVRDSNSLREASVQSSSFPPPVSSAACQVSYWDWCTCWIIQFQWKKKYFAKSLLIPCVSVQLRFSLYMYGDFNGSLLVAIEENGTGTAPLVWERNGQRADDWEDVALQLTGLHHGWVKGKQQNCRADDSVTVKCTVNGSGIVSFV